MEALEAYEYATAEFDRRIQAIKPDQWNAPVPSCPQWNVRALVNHVVSNHATVPVAVASAGTAVDGQGPGARPDAVDRLGDDPVGAWRTAREQARVALRAPGALDGSALSPYGAIGKVPMSFLVSMLTTDATTHAWDLARAIGADDKLHEELVEELHALIELAVPQMQDEGALFAPGTGLFAPPADVDPDAGVQVRLLALLGRRV